MHAPSDAVYRHVQGLSRGLAILKALNMADPAGASPRELSAATKLNRTTVKRILETLVDEGYVRPCDCEGSYGLSPEVLSLSRGLTADARLLQQSAPALKELGQRTGWSLRITTLQDNCMIIRDSTHPSSNLSFEPFGGLRRRLPMLLTAAGRACFASSSAEVRQRIVDGIRAHKDEQSALANNGKLVEQLTRRVQEDGYAINDGDWGERRLGAVGLSIRDRDGSVLASMSMIYTRRAVNQHVIENEFVPAMRHSVNNIEAHL